MANYEARQRAAENASRHVQTGSVWVRRAADTGSWKFVQNARPSTRATKRSRKKV